MKVIVDTNIFIGGKMYLKGQSAELSPADAKVLLKRGAIKQDKKLDIDITPTEELKKNDLVEYANSLGIDVPSKANKDEIIALIHEVEGIRE